MIKIKKNVIALGVTSFFTDVSSEMIMVLLPLFLTALGAGKSVVGIIEGIADATASILKIFSGWFSDHFKKRKIIVTLGYTLSTAVKPFVAIANSPLQVLGIRFLDRAGKGLRDAPRDALLADSCASDERGISFGFHRSMDTAGALTGTLLASFFLFVFSQFFTMDILTQYRTIFWIAVIPGILSVLTLILFVKEIPTRVSALKDDPPPKAIFFKGFKRFLLVMAFFELANFSYALFILRAADLGVAIALIPIVYLLYNLAYSGFSTPVGQFSDRFGRKKILALGFFTFAFMHIGFAFAQFSWQAWLLFTVYGLTVAIIETIPRAMVADFFPSHSRATAYGIYHTLVGLVILPASAIAGLLWDVFGSPVIAFSYGAVLAVIASLLLLVLVPESRSST